MPSGAKIWLGGMIDQPTVVFTKSSVTYDKLVTLNPTLLGVIDTAAAQPTVRGKPRSQMTAPISPAAQVADMVYFEEPNDPARRYYLPRYRVAQQPVSGSPHYRVRMAENMGQWRLEITLESFAAPELADATGNVQLLPHELHARLRWQIVNTGGVTRDYAFTERLDNPDGTTTLALSVATLPERDDLYTALTTQAAETKLCIDRVVRVAAPTNDRQGGAGAAQAAPASASLANITGVYVNPSVVKPELFTGGLNPILVDPNVNPVVLNPVINPVTHPVIDPVFKPVIDPVFKPMTP